MKTEKRFLIVMNLICMQGILVAVSQNGCQFLLLTNKLHISGAS